MMNVTTDLHRKDTAFECQMSLMTRIKEGTGGVVPSIDYINNYLWIISDFPLLKY